MFCDDPEIVEIVKVLKLSPITIKTENDPVFGLCKVGHVSDGSGRVIFPPDYMTRPGVDEDIGLFD